MRMIARKRRKVTKVAKKMKAIAKRVILKTTETKQYNVYLSGTNYYNTNIRSHNLTYGIAQGTSGFTRIGDVIHITGVSIKARHYNTLNNVPCEIHFALIECDLEINGTNANTMSASDVIRNSGSDPSLWRVDPERTSKIHFVKTCRLVDIIGTTNEKNKTFTYYKKLNKRFTYNPATSFGRTTNLYLITWAQVTGAGLQQTGLSIDWTLYFKDV